MSTRKTHTVETVDAYDLFQEVALELGIDSQVLGESFSQVCNDVTYGDASYTLISGQEFFSTLADALDAIDVTGYGEVLDEKESDLGTVYVNLEN